MSDARAILAALRRGDPPTEADLTWFVQGLADGGVTDAQAGAFAMAVCLHGLPEASTNIPPAGWAIVSAWCWRRRWRPVAPLCR